MFHKNSFIPARIFIILISIPIVVNFFLSTPFQTVFPKPIKAAVPIQVRHPDAGIWVAYKRSNTVADLQQPYIKGVMAYAAWSKLAPNANTWTFDWSRLDSDLNIVINQAGKKAYVEIAAGYCSNSVDTGYPAFLYARFAHTKTPNSQGCYDLQFYDPGYLPYYKQFIDALAAHLAAFDASDSHPNQTDIEFVRAHPMEETHENYAEPCSTSDSWWCAANFVPAADGHIYNQDLTKAMADDFGKQAVLRYKQALDSAYAAKGLPPSQVTAKGGGNWGPHTNHDVFLQNGIWWLVTNARFNPSGWYWHLNKDVRTGTTRGTTESYNDGVQKYLVQSNYWEILAHLHAGVEFMGIFGYSFYSEQPLGPVNMLENRPNMLFADKYAGWRFDPAHSPGAWVALRGYYPEYRWTKIQQDRLWTNYDHLMTMDAPDESVALYGTNEFLVGPGTNGVWRDTSKEMYPTVYRSVDFIQPWNEYAKCISDGYPDYECQYLNQEPTVLLGTNTADSKKAYGYPVTNLGKVLSCGATLFCTDPGKATRTETMFWARRTDKANGHNYIRFKLDQTFAASLGGKANLRVVYLDRGTDKFQLLYDSVTGVDKVALAVTKANTDIWKESVVSVTDAIFSGTNDVSFYNNNDSDDIFHMVEVQRVETDIKTLLSAYTTSQAGFDLNNDGKVNSFDFAISVR